MRGWEVFWYPNLAFFHTDKLRREVQKNLIGAQALAADLGTVIHEYVPILQSGGPAVHHNCTQIQGFLYHFNSMCCAQTAARGSSYAACSHA